MPEGPEIHRAADRLAKALVGRRAEAVRFGLPRLEEYGPQLSGRTVTAVEARGKALLTTFAALEDEPLVLYSHNQLYGRWYVTPAGRPPRTGRSLRVAIETADRWALLYSASEIEVLRPEELSVQPYLARIGPDVLARGTTPKRIERQLTDRRFRGRALGGLLLDQAFLAGIGNYLRSEILHVAGLRPEVRPRELDDDERRCLARAARTLARRSYRTGGTTEEPERVRAAQAAGEPRRSWRHAIFGRVGLSCRRCGTTIERLRVGTRRLDLCPTCQPVRADPAPARSRS